MVRRPIVWLLATLALLGAGWAAYGPLRQAWQPAIDVAGDTAGPGAEPAPVAKAPPSVPASRDAEAVTEPPAPPAAATPAEAGPAGAAPAPQLAETPAPPAARVSPPEPAPTAPPAPVATAAGPEPGPPPAPEAGPGVKASAQPRVGELAPAAAPATTAAPPVAPVTPPEPTAGRSVAAAAPEAAVSPDLATAPVIGPPAEPPTPRPAAPAASPEAREPPPAAPEHPAPAAAEVAAEVADEAAPEVAPEIVAAAPLPSTEPAAPGANPEAAAPPPARSLSLDTIRRALAALLGGASEPKDLAGRQPEVERPAPAPTAVEPSSAGAPAIVRPSFDIVRVEPGGRAVIAGRAAPGAEVELLAGERVIDRARADRRGEWIAIPAEPLPVGGLELGLRATSDGAPAVEAEQVVLVVVPEPPPPQPAPVAVAEGPPPQPAEVRQAEARPLAVLLAEDGKAPGRILQAPGRISSDGSLALLVLDYDDSGRTRLTGEAPPGAPLRIYVDNQPAAEAVTEPSGRWTAVLEHNLAPGEYTLRLDQLGGHGRPVARLETPFTRVSQPPIQGKTAVDYVIVQPGNSLWRIARRLFGSGMEYVQIYDANQAQIRDPDLIYPGQVFEIPPGVGSSG